jgi:hypothetical protein
MISQMHPILTNPHERSHTQMLHQESIVDVLHKTLYASVKILGAPQAKGKSRTE